MRCLNRMFALAVVALTGPALLSIPPAVAAPADGNTAAHITDIQHVNDRWDKVSVYSPSMDKIVVNDVLRSPRSGAPTFYLLPGIDGGDNLDPGANFAPGSKSWFGFTDLQGFFANKNVNVVSPLGGAFSWYTCPVPAAPPSTTRSKSRGCTGRSAPTAAS